MKASRSIRELGALLVLLPLALAGCINLPPGLFGAQRGPVGLQTIIPADGVFTSDEILVLDLTGVISIDSESNILGATPGMAVQLKDRLKAAEENRRIKAVILRIDSPGGGVTASDLIYHELVEFKKKKEVPVVAMMQDVAASGGLYVSMAADEIYAMPTTITGSIGVISTLPRFEGLMGKIGVEVRVIKSGRNKDIGSPWREMTEEEQRIFQSLIDGMYGRFLNVIMESRGKKGLTREKLAEFADGRVLEPAEAQKLKLIDGVCYLDAAIERTKQLAQIKDAKIVSYEYPGAYRGNIYASSRLRPNNLLAGRGGDLNLLKMDMGVERQLPSDARFMYLWMP